MNSELFLTNAKAELSRTSYNESKPKLGGLKSWQLALLVGIPSVTLVSYLVYKKYQASAAAASASSAKRNAETSKTKSNKSSKAAEAAAVVESSAQQVRKEEKKLPKTELEKAVEKKNQGNEFFQAGKFEEALRCYSEAIDLCPKSDKDELPKFYQNRAAAYENLKMHEKIVEDCTSALQIDQNYEKALTRRAKAYENLGRLQEAFEDLTSLCILQKFSSTSMAVADRIVKKIGEKMCEEIFSTRNGIPISQHFVNNFYIGMRNDAVYKNEEFLNKVKENPDSNMNEAIEAFESGDFARCIAACGREIDDEAHRPFALEARNLRGSLLMLKCQYADSRADFAHILSSPHAPARLQSNTLIKLTALNLQNNEEEDAYANYERALTIDPANEDVYCNRAQVYAMKGLFDQCFGDFDKCLEINPANRIARIQRAFFQFRQFYASLQMYAQATQQSAEQIRLQSGEFQSETSKLERVLGENADVPEALSLYAQILSEQEDYEKAERYYKMALEKDPRNAALLVQRALNQMTWQNEFEAPVAMLNQAIEIDDTCEFAFETLATIEIQRGNLSRAVELFEKAVQLTRSKESMTNLCCMLVGAKTQFKVLNHLSKNPDVLESINRNNFI